VKTAKKMNTRPGKTKNQRGVVTYDSQSPIADKPNIANSLPKNKAPRRLFA